MILPNLLGFLRRHGAEVAFLGVDQHHVAHRSLLLEVGRWPYTSTTRQPRKIDKLGISLYGGPAQETCPSLPQLDETENDHVWANLKRRFAEKWWFDLRTREPQRRKRWRPCGGGVCSRENGPLRGPL